MSLLRDNKQNNRIPCPYLRGMWCSVSQSWPMKPLTSDNESRLCWWRRDTRVTGRDSMKELFGVTWSRLWEISYVCSNILWRRNVMTEEAAVSFKSHPVDHRGCVHDWKGYLYPEGSILLHPHPLALTVFQPLLPKCSHACRIDGTDIQFGAEDW